ncbi:MAG: DUF47 domain-containing protein [Candidatus Rokubacteria bacterium]|nr:DUF47 domain-containing protein [Candidatus Rokubacteria bacterium]
MPEAWGVFPFIRRRIAFFDYFEAQADEIVTAADLLHGLVYEFTDAERRLEAIRESEHRGDRLIHEITRRLNTTFVTPLDREDIYRLGGRLDDVLDYIDEAAGQLVLYRIKEPTSACRAMADVIVPTVAATARAVRCLRTRAPAFHEHVVEVNRLENRADVLLRGSLAALFEEQRDPVEVLKWKEIYETLEAVTDRCEDVANVIEQIMLKVG